MSQIYRTHHDLTLRYAALVRTGPTDDPKTVADWSRLLDDARDFAQETGMNEREQGRYLAPFNVARELYTRPRDFEAFVADIRDSILTNHADTPTHAN